MTTESQQAPQSLLLSRAEAAALLGVSKGTLEVWASTRRYNLPFVKVGRLAKYRMADIEAFIQSRLSTTLEGLK